MSRPPWVSFTFGKERTIMSEMVSEMLSPMHGFRVLVCRSDNPSSALRDFVHETNQGDHVWFLSSLEEVGERLARRPAA
jgi:hypothetical protein